MGLPVERLIQTTKEIDAILLNKHLSVILANQQDPAHYSQIRPMMVT
jgi:hypothetical protein